MRERSDRIGYLGGFISASIAIIIMLCTETNLVSQFPILNTIMGNLPKIMGWFVVIMCCLYIFIQLLVTILHDNKRKDK